MIRHFFTTLPCAFMPLCILAQTADRGFIHPGGLHIQADFDRVKAQLAARNTKVRQAYQKLTSAAYAQATVGTSPSEVIVRGGGSGENYINAARAATSAYQNAPAVPAGQTLRLMPQLPQGEEDTGQWLWNTGETSRDITVSTDRSYVYRVTYTNQHGTESQHCFPIAARADCTPDRSVLTAATTALASFPFQLIPSEGSNAVG